MFQWKILRKKRQSVDNVAEPITRAYLQPKQRAVGSLVSGDRPPVTALIETPEGLLAVARKTVVGQNTGYVQGYEFEMTEKQIHLKGKVEDWNKGTPDLTHTP